MDEAKLYEQYSTLLEKLSTTPGDRKLHLKHFELTNKLGLEAEADQARSLYAEHLAIEPGR